MFIVNRMGESNTPPVSPRDPGPSDSDEDVTTTQNEEDFEVIEVYEEDIEEGAEGEVTEGDSGAEGEDGEEEMGEVDVPDDSVVTFKHHSGKSIIQSLVKRAI